MHRWPDAEYVNRHLLQYPISSPHHVSDMLMQPTQFLHSTSFPPLPSPCFLSSAPAYTTPAKDEQMRQRRGEEGGKREWGESGFKQNLIMMLLWTDVTHTNRHVSNHEKPGLLENNSGESRREMLSVGGRTKLQLLWRSLVNRAVTTPPFHPSAPCRRHFPPTTYQP